MSSIGSLGSYAAQLWHTRTNPENKEKFKAEQQQEQTPPASVAAIAADAKAAVDSTAGYDEAFAKLKLALASSDSTSADLSERDSATVGKTASEAFHEWMNMTPGEKLRASILKELGITEEDLAAMDPEARKTIEDSIAEKVQTLFAKQAEENQRDYRLDHGATEQELINVSV